MTRASQCKFCKAPISVQMPDDDNDLRALFERVLLPMACCNRCADLRVERRILESRLQRCCTLIRMLGPGMSKERETLRAVLTRQTKKYAELIARWHRLDGSLWEEAIVETIMEKPAEWGNILSQMWKTFHQWKRQKDAQPEMPI